MSAVRISYKHLNTVLTWVCKYDVLGRTWMAQDLDELGNVIWQENEKALNHLQLEYGQADVYKWSICDVSDISPIQFIKYLTFVDHQCDEHDDYQKSQAYETIWTIYKWVIRQLPEYKAAKWEVK